MENIILGIGSIGLIALQSCKDKNPKITSSEEISTEMMAYFVNYEIGTKWIYQDTLVKTNFDTIELIGKQEMNINNGNGVLSRGYMLDYKPRKSKDFQVRIQAGNNNSAYVKIDPLITAAGVIVFENYNGTWSAGTTYLDTTLIAGDLFYKVIRNQSSSDFHATFNISHGTGVVFFSRMNGSAILADYKLIKRINP